MCARRSKALDAATALTVLGRGLASSELRQPRQALAAPGRGATGLANQQRRAPVPAAQAFDPDAPEAREARPSKTELKKVAHDMQVLGDALAAQSNERLAALPMDEVLREALLELRRTRSREGLRRQRQLVGKLMRMADIEPLAQAVAEAQLGSARQTLALHQAEALRQDLVTKDDALTQFLAQHPGCDVQQLRSLIRAARKEAALPPEQRHGRAWRDLFQFIKPYVQP
jgi:ribosome-associated protein